MRVRRKDAADACSRSPSYGRLVVLQSAISDSLSALGFVGVRRASAR